MTNSKERELLLGSEPYTISSGFTEIEKKGNSRWRWALDLEQSLQFVPAAIECRIFYSMLLPLPGMKVTISKGQTVCLVLASEVEEEFFRGYFDLRFSEEEKNFPVILNFLTEPNLDGRRHKENPRLAFLVNRFTLSVGNEEQEISKNDLEQFHKHGSATLCALPFAEVFINEEGMSFPCCFSVQTLDDFRVMATSARSSSSSEPELFSRAWNSESVRRVRKEMILGKRPAVCRRCFEAEDSGGTSFRTEMEKVFDPSLLENAKRLTAQVTSDGRIAAPPAMLDIRLGNLCNLKCRMCNPLSSVNLIEDFEEIYHKSFHNKKTVHWHRDQKFMEEMVEVCKTISLLNLAGGEPFLIPEVKTLLTLLVSKGYSNEIHLSLITNCTVLDQTLLALFKNFKSVQLIVSLDGLHEVNDYIRYPSKFLKIEENLTFLHENMESLKIRPIKFNTTVQILNIFNIPSLLRYLRTHYPLFHWLPNLSVLTGPEEYSFCVLPKKDRHRAIDQLIEYLHEEQDRFKRKYVNDLISIDSIEKQIGSVLGHLDGPDNSHLIPDLCRTNKILDSRRTNSPKLSDPELSFLF